MLIKSPAISQKVKTPRKKLQHKPISQKVKIPREQKSAKVSIKSPAIEEVLKLKKGGGK